MADHAHNQILARPDAAGQHLAAGLINFGNVSAAHRQAVEIAGQHLNLADPTASSPASYRDAAPSESGQRVQHRLSWRAEKLLSAVGQGDLAVFRTGHWGRVTGLPRLKW
jgi:hypothetical protein